MRLIAWFFFFLPAVAFAQPEGILVDKIIAVIGDEIVLHSDVENAILENTQGQAVTVTAEERCAVIENLMYQKLLLHHAKIDSVEVADAEVQSQVERRLDYFVQMFGSIEQFEQYYGKTVAQMKDEYFDIIREQLLVQKEQQEVTKNVKVTPSDVLKYYKSIPVDSLPLMGEQVQYSKIVFQPTIRESERQRVMHFLDSVRTEVVAGRTSMTIQAARWSEDPGSRYKGGCYPLQRKGSFVPEYEAAVFTTPEGAYSPVFLSEYGYHFVKVVEKRGEFYESCHILMAPKVDANDLNRARLRADSVHAELMLGKLSFGAAAQRFSTDKETRNQDGRVSSPYTGGIRHEVSRISPEENLILRGLQPGQLSEPVLVTMPDGSQAYVIYRMDARFVAHRANLDQDYELFQARAEEMERQKETDAWVKRKLANTYSKVDADHAGCVFQFDWNKAGQ